MVSVVIGGDPNWADVAMVMGQFAAVIAALVAYLAVRRQIADAERHHKEQLHGSLRPLVIIRSARLVRLPGGVSIEVTAKNVGTGPALEVVLTAWPRPLIPDTPPWEAIPQIDLARQDVDYDHPEWRVRLGALAPGEELTRPLNPAEGVVGQRAAEGFILYMATYQDVFETSFPRKPRAEWYAGSEMLN